MFDPFTAQYALTQEQLVREYHDLNEEQFAQRFGHVVRSSSAWNQVVLQLGKFLIRIGEKLTAESAGMELSRKIL